MYHFTGGRQDFKDLPDESATLVENALAFQFKSSDKSSDHSTIADLQNWILEAQDLFSSLRAKVEGYGHPDNLPALKPSLAPIVIEDEEEDSDSDEE